MIGLIRAKTTTHLARIHPLPDTQMNPFLPRDFEGQQKSINHDLGAVSSIAEDRILNNQTDLVDEAV